MTNDIQQFPEIAAMLQHQSAVAAAQAVIDQLHQAIAVQQEKTSQLQAKAETVAQLEVLREDLLADIATGAHGKAAALEVLSARLEKQKKELSEQGTQAAIAQTLAGLGRKLERAMTALQQLEEKRPALVRRMVLAQAEAVGHDYVKAAREVGGLFRRLLALAEMLRDLGHVPGIAMGSGASLEVPAFRLESVAPHADHVHRRDFSLSPSAFVREDAQRWQEDEKIALRTLGVEI